MKRLHRILLLILAICCISIPAFADDPGQDLPASFEEGAVRDLPVSAGPLRINMSYNVKFNLYVLKIKFLEQLCLNL